MSKIETIAYLFSNLFRIYVLYRFTERFFKESKMKKEVTIGAFIIYFMINSAAHILIPGVGMNIISNLVPYFAVTLLYKSTVPIRALVTIIIYSISTFADVALFSIQSFLQIETIVVSGGIATSLSLFLLELLYEYFFSRNEENKEEINVGELLFIIFIPVGSIVIAFRTMKLADGNYLPEAFILFAINGVVFYMYDALKKSEKQKMDKLKLEQQNALYENQIRIQNESNEKIRLLRHDMKNHIYQIKAFLKRKDYEKLEEYMNRMSESTETESVVCHSGNSDVDGIVNLKLSKAKEMNAELHFDLKIPDKLNIDAFDLNRILGNLFDNVLNALEKVDRRIVFFQMLYEKGVVNICIRNSFNGEIKTDSENRLLSLKKDSKESHGLGIKSVVETIEKYHGEFEYECEKNVFSIYAMMYEN